MVVLGGELAVPFTRNPLHAGLNSRFRVSTWRSVMAAVAARIFVLSHGIYVRGSVRFPTVEGNIVTTEFSSQLA